MEYVNGALNDARADFVLNHAVVRIESAIKDLADAGKLTAANMDRLTKVTKLLTGIVACLVATIAIAFLAVITSSYGVAVNVSPSKLEIRTDK